MGLQEEGALFMDASSSYGFGTGCLTDTVRKRGTVIAKLPPCRGKVGGGGVINTPAFLSSRPPSLPGVSHWLNPSGPQRTAPGGPAAWSQWGSDLGGGMELGQRWWTARGFGNGWGDSERLHVLRSPAGQTEPEWVALRVAQTSASQTEL